MPYKLKVLPKSDFCVIGLSGKVTPQEFDEIWTLLESSPSFRADMDDLFVMSPDVEYSEIASQMTEAQARRYVEMYPAGLDRRPKRSAHLCMTGMQRTMVKMFAAYVDAWGAEQVEIDCFNALEPALAWLEASKRAERRLDRAAIHRLLRQMGYGWCCVSSARSARV